MAKNEKVPPASVLNIHKLIEKNAAKAPEAIAISFNGSTITYGCLNERANQLAHFLVSEGVRVETFVGISVERSIEMIISILAILKAGGTYIPIDSSYPKERMHYISRDSEFPLLITKKTLLSEFVDFPVKKILLDANEEIINSFSKTNLPTNINADNLAYVLYTSGSTGNPKGVMVCHRSIIHAYHGWKETYKLTNHDCHLQMANFSFDVFTGDLIRALGSGAKLTLCPRDVLLKPEKLYRLMISEKINCAEFVPTVLRKLITHIEKENKPLDFMRLLICGSDNWSMHEYRKLQRLCEKNKNMRIINSYGLTEATIDSSYFEEPLSDKEIFNLDCTVPLGKPFPNTEILLLDERQQFVPKGDVGEIYIGGDGLARGYLNRPDLTSRKFIRNPFKTRSNTKLYKTGDLGRYLPDGNIEFLGRIDTQVKLRGVRIDLAGIENIINCHSNIRESLVTIQEDQKHHQRLIAYMVTEENIKLDITDLRKFLKEHLPRHMIPSFFIELTSLPITPNGKLDRQALGAHFSLPFKSKEPV